jgi:hypothetical protein
VESDNFSNNVILSDALKKAQRDGYVNNAFEDGPQKSTDKVNDKHNVHLCRYIYICVKTYNSRIYIGPMGMRFSFFF